LPIFLIEDEVRGITVGNLIALGQAMKAEVIDSLETLLALSTVEGG
jgi:hypothetical protein